jgi:hypothetical protein
MTELLFFLKNISHIKEDMLISVFANAGHHVQQLRRLHAVANHHHQDVLQEEHLVCDQPAPHHNHSGVGVRAAESGAGFFLIALTCCNKAWQPKHEPFLPNILRYEERMNNHT